MYVRDRGQKTVRKGQEHKGSRTPVTNETAGIGDVVGFCAHCRAMRNMRATQEKRILTGKKRTLRDIIATYHGETCGLLIKDEYPRSASWDNLINSPDNFLADFMAERST